jgi:hypothetical protein
MASPRTRLKRMWRLGSSHCRKRGEGGSQIQIIDGAALEESGIATRFMDTSAPCSPW